MLRLLLAPVCLVAFFATVAACPQEKGKKVKVTVVVILASETGNKIDKQLKHIAEEVRNLYPNLKSFELVWQTKKDLAVDEKGIFDLKVEKQTAQVIVKQPADKENKVGLAITVPEQREIHYVSACGKFLPIVTRYQTKKKERLILAVSVQPCNGN